MTDQSSKQRRRTLICAILAIAATHDQWTRCWAQEVKDVHAGYELASKVCSPCHVVAPLPAPSFMDIAKSQYGSLAPLENLLRSTHSDVGHPGGMPNISLSREQIRTISAYIGSLREAR
jgi:mono/diheme cytochrome c family protein